MNILMASPSRDWHGAHDVNSRSSRPEHDDAKGSRLRHVESVARFEGDEIEIKIDANCAYSSALQVFRNLHSRLADPATKDGLVGGKVRILPGA